MIPVLSVVVVERGGRKRETQLRPSTVTFDLSRRFFPSLIVPPTLGVMAVSLAKQIIIFQPCITGITFNEGLSLLPKGLYQVMNGYTLRWQNFTLTFNIRQRPMTRSVTFEYQPDFLSSTGHAIFAPANTNHPNTRPPHFPETLVLHITALNYFTETLPIWLPGPGNYANPPMGGVMTRVLRQAGGWCQSADTAVFQPIRNEAYFRTLVGSLPSRVTTLLLHVFDTDQVNDLRRCVEIASTVLSVRQLCVENHVVGAAFPRINGGYIPFRSFGFSNINSNNAFSFVVETLENSDRIQILKLSGTVRYLEAVLEVMRTRCTNVVCLGLTLTDEGDPSELLRQLQAIPQRLYALAVYFRQEPNWLQLRTVLVHGQPNLVEVDIRCPPRATIHHCDGTCGDLQFLPPRAGNLRKVKISNLPCSGIILATVMMSPIPVKTKIKVSPSDHFRSVARFLVNHQADSHIHELNISGLPSFNCLLNLPTIWSPGPAVTLEPVSLLEVPRVLASARLCEEITLWVYIPQNVVQAIMEGFDANNSCDSGICDHYFTGLDEEHRSLPGWWLGQMDSLRSLRIVFLDRYQSNWSAPALGMCMYQFGIRFLPGLRYFNANKISNSLMVALDDHARTHSRFKFDCQRFDSTPLVHL